MSNSGTDETVTESTDNQLTVERVFDASPSRIFAAFTNAEELEEWYAPGQMTTVVNEFDARSEGTFDISMQGGESPHDVRGQFIEVVENERLVHTWQGPSGGETKVTVTFDEVEEGTKVVLTHEEFESEEAVKNHTEGWTGIFENLAEYL